LEIFFYSPEAFERWDWRNPDTKGIGGSETAHIEMATRLARRGYRVTSYTPLPEDCPDKEHKGVSWRDCSGADFSRPGLWVLGRCPQVLDNLDAPGQLTWLVCQDEDYKHKWTPARLKRVDRVLALCNSQGHQFLSRYPELAGKVCVSSNGLKPELVETTRRENHPRNPRRMMYASSPDRALVPLLNIFARVREFVPDAELHVAYGFDNIDKMVEHVAGSQKKSDRQFLSYVADLKTALTAPGIVWHRRLPQADLYREWSKSGIWCYPCSRFRETSCITSMEAQALGAIPVFSPLWAVGENCHFGVSVEGDHEDPLTIARFTQAVVSLMLEPEKQDLIRAKMQDEARRVFSYERFCDQYEAWMHGYANGSRATEQQHAFHLAHRRGRVLNVGCNDDAGELREWGVNVDVMKGQDPWTGREVKVDIQADARILPSGLRGNFGTVALSDVLEHFEDDGAVDALLEARSCLKPGGRITVTVPEDYSDPNKRENFTPGQLYCGGVYAYHWRPCQVGIVRMWAEEAGLEEKFYRTIDYGFCWGHGFVFEPKGETVLQDNTSIADGPFRKIQGVVA
jgi:glycosyltransferase involved in cell wall biosynthesis